MSSADPSATCDAADGAAAAIQSEVSRCGPQAVMEKLERTGRLAAVNELAAEIEKHISDEKIGDYGTPVEYCLFAKHKETGLPVLAQLPHNWGDDVPVHLFYCHRIYKIFEAFYEGNEAEHVLFDVVADYAEKHPGTLPPTALFYFIARSCRNIAKACEHILPHVFRKCAASLGPATAENWLEETQLMEFVRFRRNWTTAKILAEFMRSVPRAEDAVNMQHPVDGTTAAHVCVRRSKFDSLKILVDHGAKIFDIKDRNGWTAVDLAKASGKFETLAEAIPEAVADETSPPDPAAGGTPPSHFSGVPFGKFPKLCVPSDPTLKPSDMNAFMDEYVSRELPELIGEDPALVVLPPIDGTGVPIEPCTCHETKPSSDVQDKAGPSHQTPQKTPQQEKPSGDELQDETSLSQTPQKTRQQKKASGDIQDKAGRTSRTPQKRPPEEKSIDLGSHHEMNVLISIKNALEKLREKRPDLSIVCFHGLRYGCVMPKLGNWETDFDTVVMIRDKTGQLFAVFMFEVKSIASQRDVVNDEGNKNSGRSARGMHALDQLCNHYVALEELVGDGNISSDWVIPVLALPAFPTRKPMNVYTDKSGPKKEEESLEKSWRAYLDRCADPQKAEKKEHSYVQPRLMTRLLLEKKGALSAWFERELDSIKDSCSSLLGTPEFDTRKQKYATIEAWCVAHCMGVAIQRISHCIEVESENAMTEQLAQLTAPQQSEGEEATMDQLAQITAPQQRQGEEATTDQLAQLTAPQQRQGEEATTNQLALLTKAQKKAYDMNASNRSQPLMIAGTAGTGKTLLGVYKLIKCFKDGLMNEDKKGLFLTHARNRPLIALVKKMLRMSGADQFVEVRGLTPRDEKALKEELERAVAEKFSFVVIDQLEDILYLTGEIDHTDCAGFVESLKESGEMLAYLMQLTCFDLFWLTVNPMDLPGARAHIDFRSFFLDQEKKSESQLLYLNKRIRNTTSIGVIIGDPEAGEVYLPLHFGAEPMNIRKHSAAIGPRCSAFAEFFEEETDGPTALAEVIYRLRLKHGVEDKHIVVINVENMMDGAGTSSSAAEAAGVLQWLKGMDAALLRQPFHEPIPKIPSMAPLLVCAVWVGDIKEALHDEETLMVQVKECLVNATSPDYQHTTADQDDASPMENLRRLLFDDKHRDKLVQWLDSVPEHVRESVAFQATMSLVIRYVGYASSCSSDEEGQKKGKLFLDKLEKAITASDSKDLTALVARQPRFISVLNYTEIRGYEADVVVVANFSNVYKREFKVKPAQLLSRAKIMVVLVSHENGRAPMESVIGSLSSFSAEPKK